MPRILCLIGANVDERDGAHLTALHEAALHHSHKIAFMLIEAGNWGSTNSVSRKQLRLTSVHWKQILMCR